MSVYFAKVGRYLKIGFSKNPERRIANLWKSTTRYSRPWDLSLTETRNLLLVIEGDKTTEYWVHHALAAFAAGCEWFIDEPPVRAFMARAEAGEFSDDEFPTIVRESGEFEPASHELMPPERREELDRMLARARAS